MALRCISFLLYFSLIYSLLFVYTSGSVCRHESEVFIDSLSSRCPLEISPNPPLQVDGEFLDRILMSKHTNAYTSVLFYASWCPFSRSLLPTFEKLSFMFPQIEHLAIEQSSAMPSLFSRYGIHSLPAILLVNQASIVRYHGPKSLDALVEYYEKTTGHSPVQYFTYDQPGGWENSEESTIESWKGTTVREMLTREPYLVFAVWFLVLRMLAYIFPKVLSHLKAFLASCVSHLNSEIFGETSQFMGRLLHMVDVRRFLTKLRLSKVRNFHGSARNAQAWASSLASVSLGKSSSSKSL